MKALLQYLIFCCLCSTIQAAPESPLEGLFGRAETVWLARVASVSGSSVTVHCTELLRGKNDGDMVLSVDGYNSLGGFLPRVSLRVGSEFLLLSQGDEKNGLPRPVIGHSFESQFSYRGWTPFPIKRRHHQIHIEGTLSFADHPFVEDLTLTYVKQLLDRFPYGSTSH